ncbi:hypothetical protein GCM10018954_036740 [Kutzneria kofuensis]
MLSRLRRTTVILGAAALLAGATTLTTTSAASADTQICDKYGSVRVSGGRYLVQNNEWGDDTTQCLSVRDDGFTITTANHNKPTNGAPASYPSIYAAATTATARAAAGFPNRWPTSTRCSPPSPTPSLVDSGTRRTTSGSTRTRTRRGRTPAPN